MAVGVLQLAAASGPTGALLYAVIYGSFFGSSVTLTQVVYADYFGRRALGLIRGSAQPVQLAFNAAGPLATGLWFNRTGSYDAAFALFALLFLVAAVALAFSPRPVGVSDRSP
jgi:cyanate permease